METATINANDVKKDLYKSKVNAKFSHYTSGNLYYTVELADGIYQFPISTIETMAIDRVINKKLYTEIDEAGEEEKTHEEFYKILYIESEENGYEEATASKLSSDLGTTSFFNEMKGSDLNRWISKAIEKGEFIKIS